MNREIKINDQILFLWNGWSGDEDESVFDGNVIRIDKDTVVVSILYGYKSSTEDVKTDRIIAIYDPKGTHNKFHGYSGTGFVTELGKKWLEE